jgi:hypothetical protein
MRIATRKRRTMIVGAAYVLSNCGASVPGGGATKLHFTSACDEAALRALTGVRAPIWMPVQEQGSAPPAAFVPVLLLYPAEPPVPEQRSPLALPGPVPLRPPLA